MKAWRYRFELREAEKTKESTFAIGEYCNATSGETLDDAKARGDGGRFTLSEALSALSQLIRCSLFLVRVQHTGCALQTRILGLNHLRLAEPFGGRVSGNSKPEASLAH